MILKRLFEADCFDYNKFILDNLKHLMIDADEAIVLIKIIEYYKETDIFNLEKLKETAPLSKKKFDLALSSLLDKGFYSIYLKESNGISEEAISIEGFFDRCEVLLSSTTVKDAGEFQEILRLVSINLNKILTANEIEVVKSLVEEDMYSKTDFENAFVKLKDKNVVNIKSLISELEKGRKTGIKNKENNVPQGFLDFVNNIK
ncbi:MAG: hypothetical protein K6F81_04015 [Acholeplasmatales bacterium]|nr:hypothetical protein [Acholeplasmatales bacterium]